MITWGSSERSVASGERGFIRCIPQASHEVFFLLRLELLDDVADEGGSEVVAVDATGRQQANDRRDQRHPRDQRKPGRALVLEQRVLRGCVGGREVNRKGQKERREGGGRRLNGEGGRHYSVHSTNS